MSEDDLDARIRVLAAGLGLRRFHPFDSRKSDRGWPDLVLVGPGGILYRELKTETKSPTPAQQAWLDVLSAAGGNAACWRPSDLLSGRIAKELTAIAGLPVREVAT
jgi:hypothetical protein